MCSSEHPMSRLAISANQAVFRVRWLGARCVPRGVTVFKGDSDEAIANCPGLTGM